MSDKRLVMVSKILQELQEEIYNKKKEYYNLAKQLPLIEIDDYLFKDIDNNDVKLSELFKDKDQLIVVHNMGQSCPYCTMWADGFNGVFHHIESQAAFVVVSPDPVDNMKKFYNEKSWKFKLLSCASNTFKADLAFENNDKELIPGVSTFRKENDKIFITSSLHFGPGDDFCSVWYFFDLLHHKDDDWMPKHMY